MCATVLLILDGEMGEMINWTVLCQLDFHSFLPPFIFHRTLLCLPSKQTNAILLYFDDGSGEGNREKEFKILNV